jgi:hypothetical protein
VRKKLIWFVPLALAGLAAFVGVGGAVVQLLWNWLLPSLFGWREITFWQALGLLALCRILFGGLGAHGSRRSSIRRRVEDRCLSLTPEERERFRQRLHERWSADRPVGETDEQ